MWVRLLGTAAGGGFPQWNCNCANCRGLRTGAIRARPRTQSSVAVSADGTRWFLVNASPDAPAQIESFAPLRPGEGVVRGTGLQGMLLTNADLDHTLGLLVLREGPVLTVHATPAVRAALDEGLRLSAVLGCYGGVEWREPPSGLAPLRDRAREPSGLRYAAFPVPGKPPRYRAREAGSAAGCCVGYLLVDERTGGRLVVAPDVAALGDRVMKFLDDSDALLLDGTFWSDDEMRRAGVGALTAADMGHLPVGGPAGSLARVAPLPAGRKVYMHINNTNPMLREDSPERYAVEAAGAEVGYDGLEFRL